MISNDIVVGLFLLFQTVFGVLGNSFLMGLYIITFFIGPRLKPIDFLLIQLAFANDLVLLSKGIPQTMAALGYTNFLDDVGCKLVFYFHKVARDLSRCTTCLLSGFQVITLSPSISQWAKLKARPTKYIVQFCFFCWTFHLLANYNILVLMKDSQGSSNITERKNFVYCSAKFPVSLYIGVFVFLISLPDVLCVGIMVGTSGYMIFVLYRHHQRVQYIHGHSLKPSCSPETRATQTILLLVILFVSFFSVNSILVSYIYYEKSSSFLVHTSTFLAACFPACSSFILIVGDSHVRKYWLIFWEKMITQF
ncbi:vomeronasal type-1 receptor 1-like [Dromiciops gliroides]|uniref:vomeronasal type-1 receptor 1-like n=1 Tax=Dromiciops gliroides TaxID=33562 RepID=UPI001CC48BE1|nr:vomeronasal type-1 receptor 1-like [Dromiciops gliroides]